MSELNASSLGGEPEALSESEAMLVWARAAQLQHGDADAPAAPGRPASPVVPGARGATTVASGMLEPARVAEAALEAGVAGEFVALSLAETQGLATAERQAMARVSAEQVVRVFGSDADGVQVSVLVAAPPDEILATLGRLLVQAPWLLDLERVVQPLALAPGVARWRIPSQTKVANAMESSGSLPALCYRAAVLGITHLHTMVVPRPEHGDGVHEVLFAADLRAARASRVARLPVVQGALAATAGLGTVALAALVSGGAVALPALAGAAALGGTLAAVTRPLSDWRYRTAVSVLRREMHDMATAVRDQLARSYSGEAERVIRAAMPDTSLRARLRRLVLPVTLIMPIPAETAMQPARDSLPRATPEVMGMSSAALERATAVLQSHIDAGDIAGVVAAVMRDGYVVHQVALGMRDVDTGDLMPKDALFRLYSMTRPVTSTAILLLHDEGRLSVHDSLVKWLPAFAGQRVLTNAADGMRRDMGRDVPPTRARAGDITLAQLLTHTSGIGSRDAPLYRAHDVHRYDKTLAEVVAGVAALPLFEDPGTRYRYGMHAEVLGRVIEVVTGQPVDTFLRERLFQPLGMRDAVFHVDTSRAARLATVHRRDADRRLRPHAMEPIDVTGDRRLVSAGVGLVASTEDMLRFGQLFLDEGRVGDRQLLSPAAVRLARENAVPEALLPLPGGSYWAGSGWTLGGFAVALDPSRYNHPVRRGEFWWDGSAGTRFWIDPVERLVIVVQAQVSPAGGGGFRERFRAAVEEALVVRKERERSQP